MGIINKLVFKIYNMNIIWLLILQTRFTIKYKNNNLSLNVTLK